MTVAPHIVAPENAEKIVFWLEERGGIIRLGKKRKKLFDLYLPERCSISIVEAK